MVTSVARNNLYPFTSWGRIYSSATEEPNRRVKPILVTALIVIIGASIVAIIFRQRTLDADVRESQLVVDDTTRNFRIVIPHRIIRPTPVVFAFHGIGDSTDSMANYSGLDRIAAQNGFILVYPAASNSMWATINIDLSNLDTNPDVQFFDRLLDHLNSVHEIDRDRIYLMGMSNGASFAQILATARSDVVAALVAHSGSRLKGLAECDRSLPIMLVVGANDSVCSMMESDAEQYRLVGHTVEYISVPRLAHEWSTHHNSDMWRFLYRHVRQTGNVAEPSDAPESPSRAF